MTPNAPNRRQNTACDACKIRKTRCSLSTINDPNVDIQLVTCDGCARRNITCSKTLSKLMIPQKLYTQLHKASSRNETAEEGGLNRNVAEEPETILPAVNTHPSNSIHPILLNSDTAADEDQRVCSSSDVSRPTGNPENPSFDDDRLPSSANFDLVSYHNTQSGDAFGVVFPDIGGPFPPGSPFDTNTAPTQPLARLESRRYSSGDTSFDKASTSSSTFQDLAPAWQFSSSSDPFTPGSSSAQTYPGPDSLPSLSVTCSAKRKYQIGQENLTTSPPRWSNQTLDLPPPGDRNAVNGVNRSKRLKMVDNPSPTIISFSDQTHCLGRMADRKELSRCLVNTYLAVVHAQYPVVDPDLLRRKFDAAGQDADRLPPLEQVTFAAIEAWAARFSLHPGVLQADTGSGLYIVDSCNPESSKTDSPVIAATDRVKIGHARTAVCDALKDRALRLMDSQAIARKPSIEGVKIMLLLSELMAGHLEGDGPNVENDMMEVSMLKSSVAEQIKTLHKYKRLIPSSTSELLEGHRVVCAAWIMDAFAAATTGQKFELPESLIEEIFTPFRSEISIPHPFGSLPSSGTQRFMTNLRNGWINCGKMARYIAKHIAQPSIDTQNTPRYVQNLVEAAGTVWQAEDDGRLTLHDHTAEVIDWIRYGNLSSKSLSLIISLVNIQVLYSCMACIVHGWISNRRTQLASENAAAIIVDPEGSSDMSTKSSLNNLHKLSQVQVLHSAAGFLPLLTAVLPLNLFQNASLIMLNLTALAQETAGIPTAEEGTLIEFSEGGLWTRNKKFEVVILLREALSQSTSSWPHICKDVEALDRIIETLIR